MGRKPGVQYRGGSFWRVDDRSGFTVRAGNTREEWNALIVDQKLWEIRQPQDFVKGVMDPQWVPDPRPTAPIVYDGPIYTQTQQAYGIGSATFVVESTAGFTNGDPVGIMLNNGEIFRSTLNGAPTGNSLTFAAGIPSPVASGNDVIDYAVHIPPLPYANLSTG